MSTQPPDPPDHQHPGYPGYPDQQHPDYPGYPGYPDQPPQQGPEHPPYGGQPAPYAPQWDYQHAPGDYYPAGQQPPAHPSAQTSMVLGLIAAIGFFLCFVPAVLGPFAWVKGLRARREIDAEPGRWSGRDQAQVGYITGVIATVLLGLGILAGLAILAIVIVVGATAESGTVT